MIRTEGFGIAFIVIIGIAMVSIAIGAIATGGEKEFNSMPMQLCADKIDSVEVVNTSDGAICVIMSFLDGSSKTLCDRNLAG